MMKINIENMKKIVDNYVENKAILEQKLELLKGIEKGDVKLTGSYLENETIKSVEDKLEGLEKSLLINNTDDEAIQDWAWDLNDLLDTLIDVDLKKII